MSNASCICGASDGQHYVGCSVLLMTEIDRLTAENERLRDMVRRAYNDGFGEGIKEHTTHRGGNPWPLSKWPAALSQPAQPAPSAWRPGREASAAAFLLEAMRAKRVDPFDAVDPNIERLAIAYSNEGGDAVMVLEAAEKFMIAGLEAIVNAYTPALTQPAEKGGV